MIWNHFRYYWDNDRIAIVLQSKDYFDHIPIHIREYIITKFLFADVLDVGAFSCFFTVGRRYDNEFLYKVSFGLMPRNYQATPDDRYIIDEEGDVTEITFIVSGNWAIAFDMYISDTYVLETLI